MKFDQDMIFSKFGPYNLETKFLLFKTRKIDFYAPYIGEKLREFLRKFNPNPCLNNPKLGLGLEYSSYWECVWQVVPDCGS